MNKLAILLLLAGFSTTALAATRASVDQVEQLLSSAHNLPDAKLAEKLSGLELIERATSARLSRWQHDFPGKRTQEALLVLADASAFLDLPLQDGLPIAEPDSEARKQIFLRAIAYANKTIKKLPNFSAKRTTTHFDNVSPIERLRNQYMADRSNGSQHSMAPSMPPGAGLTRVGDQTSIVVTYRDGQEVVDAQPANDKKSKSREIGLTTFGEFGPILSVVIADAMHGKIFWSHWEQGATDKLAVFRYLVPQEISHFTVLGAGNMTQLPSYHGEISVDPASGTILRVTLVSDYKPPFQPSESAVQVEYGPVQIGDATYTCPVKGVALSRVPIAGTGNPNGELNTLPTQTFVNDVTFTEYHVFRGEVHIVP